MEKSDIAALLALGSALFIAIGDVLHQRQAQAAPDSAANHGKLFLDLLKNPKWWLGSGVAAIGFALQAAALGLGSVLVVQALLVTSLLFALPISARLAHRSVTRWEWTWAILLAAAVAVIVTVGDPKAGHSRASLHTWALVVAILGPLLVLCVLAANRLSGHPASAVLLAIVSGALWGLWAVLTKGVVHVLGDGLRPLLTSPELYAWAVVGVAGTLYQQSSFRAGAITASLPTMTVTEPLVGSVLGVVVLGETLRPGDTGVVFLVIAIVVMVVATAALARGEAKVAAPRR